MEEKTADPTGDELTQTLAQVRHELRTPLNHIIGYSELLLDQAEEEGRGNWKTDLGKIRDAGRQLLSLLSLLLTPEGMNRRLYAPPGTDTTGAGKPLRVLEGGMLAPVTALASTPTGSQAAKVVRADLPLMVVDDDANNREVLSRLLGGMGYRVREASDGSEAMALLAAAPCDVIFLDVIMPEMDGYQTLKAIQEDEVLRYTPVIMISGVDELQVVAHCIEAGAQDYLPKPFNPTLLKARLAGTLERKRLRDQEQELFAQLAEAHDRLSAANEQLRDIERMRGDMVAELMQDLRGALTAMDQG
jgi:CheY-like chemotaxis protein